MEVETDDRCLCGMEVETDDGDEVGARSDIHGCHLLSLLCLSFITIFNFMYIFMSVILYSIKMTFNVVSTILYCVGSFTYFINYSMFKTASIFVLCQSFHTLLAISMFCQYLILWQPF
jgi:hypothetical protein